MSRARKALGDFGEKVAVAHLQRQGYHVIETNYRCPTDMRVAGEIDIVARQGDCLVIVEVRTRRSAGFGTAAESVTRLKLKRLRELAEAYAQHHPGLPGLMRVDVIAIEVALGGEVSRLEHIENAADR